MTDTVQKKDVIDLVKNYYYAPFCRRSRYADRKLLLDNIILAIKCIPSTQTEITRCKDCKYIWKSYIGESYFCNRTKSTTLISVMPDDFCSYGERKKDE